MLKPKQITPPATAILSVAEVKQHLRVDFDDDDAKIEALIAAAEAHFDGRGGILGRALVNQVWRLETVCWPAGSTILPMPDVSAATISYFDASNALQTLDASAYRIVERSLGSSLEWDGSFSAPGLYPRDDAVRIDMTCGYGPAASNVPRDILHAAKMLIAAWYANPEATASSGVQELPVPAGVSSILTKHRYRGIT